MNTEKIKDLCKQKGVSINTLETESGIGRNNIARWERYTPTAQICANPLTLEIARKNPPT